MSLSIKTSLATTASANATTTVEANAAIPHNCHTITIYNPDTTNEVYFTEASADPANPLSVLTSTRVKPQTYFSLTIGTRSTRVNNNTVFGYSTSAGSINVNITYVCTNIV